MSEENGKLNAVELEAIGLFTQLARMAGQPKSYAEIYGMLFVSSRPLTVEEMVERLGSSRAAVERALRFLRKAGAARLVYVPGDRRTRYEAVAELRHLVAGFVRDQFLPELSSSMGRIERLVETVDKLPPEERGQVGQRMAMLQRWGRKGQTLVPMLVKLLDG